MISVDTLRADHLPAYGYRGVDTPNLDALAGRLDGFSGADIKYICDRAAVVPFLLLGISGWIGGKMSYEHKIGVVEGIDPEAREIGMREASR